MSLEENKALVRRYFTPPPAEEIQKIMSAKDPVAAMQESYRTVAEEIFAPDVIFHMPDGDGDRESIIQYNSALISGFPDLSFDFDKMIAEGDSVAVLGRMRGTNLGPYNGRPATGRKVDVGYIVIYSIANGKFIEVWGYIDTLGLMQQLGVIPQQ
jgi:predicted ester cyclase